MHSQSHLLIIACSAAKQSIPASAIELYRGVMYGTYRANVLPDATPRVVVLSALHGFVDGQQVIAPYDCRMTPARSDELLADLDNVMRLEWPNASSVMLAGGAMYRNVMRAAVARLVSLGTLERNIAVHETSGGIGYQRQQLGHYLRSLAAQPTPHETRT